MIEWILDRMSMDMIRYEIYWRLLAMDQELAKNAALEAIELLSVIEDPTLKPVGFGVLFRYLLDLNDRPTELPVPAAKASATSSKATKVKTKSKVGPMQRVRELADDGFFKTPRSLKTTIDELVLRGHQYDAQSLSKMLQRLVQARVLRRARGNEGTRQVFLYTDW